MICRRSVLALGLLVTSPASGQSDLTLDPRAIARWVRERSPVAAANRARVDEARALRIGSGAVSPVNPELSAHVGPRWLPGQTGVDVFAGIAWPFDLSPAPARRSDLAEGRARLAETESDAARRLAVGEALDLWARARGAEARTALEIDRRALDDAMLRAAESRKRAGTTGDGEVALARVVRAQGVARAAIAEGERDAFVAELRGRLGLEPGRSVSLAGSLTPSALPPLPELLSRLPSQPVLVRAAAMVRVTQQDEALQRAIVFQVPRVTAGAGHESETFAHFGVDVPLPFYQRNQTNEAVAAARARTAVVESAAARTLADAELRSVYATYEATRRAYRALDDALPELADAEHLGLRAYELGQSTLMELVVSRRETAQARAAHLDALVALARARIALDVLVGTLP